MQLEIISPGKKIYTGENIYLIQVPGTKGCFEIMKNHESIISTLEKGKVRIVNSQGEENAFDIQSGILECSKNKIIILTN